MLVVDYERSEHGPQRRKTSSGRLLHCCCVCGAIETWGSTWSTYCSMKEMDDCVAVPKFCSAKCISIGGPKAQNITEAMKTVARDKEWREPELAYREETDREKYNRIADEQRRRRSRATARNHSQGGEG